jgi:hypothetical protein
MEYLDMEYLDTFTLSRAKFRVYILYYSDTPIIDTYV